MSLLPGTHKTGTIRQLDRRRNSANGNPSWRIILDSGLSWNTKTDSAVGHLLSPSWVGDQVTVAVDGRGQVIDAERVAR